MKLFSLLACVLVLASSIALSQSPETAKTTDNPDTLVVPAGTMVKVDLWEHQVSWPVQHGFTTLIPALSKVAFSSARLEQVLYSQPLGSSQRSAIFLPPQKTVQLTSVTIGGKSYTIEAAAITVPENQRDVEFTLTEPLHLER